MICLLVPAVASAGEECAPLGGICRPACGADEEAAVGAFLDCSVKEECCVKKDQPRTSEKKPEQTRPAADEKARPQAR